MKTGVSETVIAIDIDWAPDFAIEIAADELRRHAVKATWFVTHRSPAIEALRNDANLFELGIHPNFLSHSSHGNDPREILEHCLEIVPEARAFRNHGLIQSTHLTDVVMSTTKLIADVNTYLPHAPNLSPVNYFWRKGRIVRLPFIWEDDLETEQPRPIWDPCKLTRFPGLKVFAFHPIHIVLNSRVLRDYAALKAEVGNIQTASPNSVASYRCSGEGAGTAFSRLLEELSGRGGGARVSDIVRDWFKSDL